MTMIATRNGGSQRGYNSEWKRPHFSCAVVNNPKETQQGEGGPRKRINKSEVQISLHKETRRRGRRHPSDLGLRRPRVSLTFPLVSSNFELNEPNYSGKTKSSLR